MTHVETVDHRPTSTQGLSPQDLWWEFRGFCEVRCGFTPRRNCSSQLTLRSYAKAVNKNTQQLESLLKVIVTPVVSHPSFLSRESRSTASRFQDPPEGFILNYTLLIGDDAYYNFQKVRNMF